VERGEEVIELDGLASEDPFPLRRGDAWWSSSGNFDPEFTTGDISVENSQQSASFSTAGTLGRIK
jgi:hypothetical protein